MKGTVVIYTLIGIGRKKATKLSAEMRAREGEREFNKVSVELEGELTSSETAK